MEVAPVMLGPTLADRKKKLYPYLRLQRFLQTPTGTLGRLSIEGIGFVCYTMERPWKMNKPCISCIPAGSYDMILGRYNRGGYPAYQLLGVPGRDLIKIHAGNKMTDSLGCILLGLSCAWVDGGLFVTYSRKTHKGFMELMGGTKTSKISITEEWA